MRAHVAAGHRCLHAWVVGVARVAGERAHPARVPPAAAATAAATAAAGPRALVTRVARKGAAARSSAALPLLHGLVRLRAPTQPLGSGRGGLGLRSAAHLLPRGSGRRAAAHGGAAAVCRSADGQTQISERPERSSLAPAQPDARDRAPRRCTLTATAWSPCGVVARELLDSSALLAVYMEMSTPSSAPPGCSGMPHGAPLAFAEPAEGMT